ncbi:hypothetical protein L226DRAFT_525076 [Lentinus tigrinus ALCF2SS1-7]|uniref:uncharacterized protein n=1 Tax=Lentinus tigrinus ALCF2SS1-7 TaxID=1328758 RepID=UPI001165EDBF|nr:hypothetical protein L226DRAFT_525076 [Lentinus tigrinus ALCF2SS1-7]
MSVAAPMRGAFTWAPIPIRKWHQFTTRAFASSAFSSQSRHQLTPTFLSPQPPPSCSSHISADVFFYSVDPSSGINDTIRTVVAFIGKGELEAGLSEALRTTTLVAGRRNRYCRQPLLRWEHRKSEISRAPPQSSRGSRDSRDLLHSHRAIGRPP